MGLNSLRPDKMLGGGGWGLCKNLLLHLNAGLGSSTVDQVLKYPKYIPSTSTGQVLIFLNSTSVHQVQVQVPILKFVLKSGWTYRAE